MTKKEAIQEMRKGYKITHVHFSDNEWMTIKDGKLLLEDGVVCSISEFFSWRQDDSWEEGYSIYKD